MIEKVEKKLSNKKEEQVVNDDWKAMAFSLVTKAIKQSSTNIVQGVQERVDSVVHAIVKKMVITFLILLGVAFALVGGAQLIGMALGLYAYGYLIVGGGILIVASLMLFAQKD